LNNAELNYAELNYAELNNAELNGAKLNNAKLNYAELIGAKLNNAKLNNAKLIGAKLNGAEFDFSCLPLWCGSLHMITDRRFRAQISYHLFDMLKNAPDLSDDEKKIMEILKPYANEMHRTDVPRFE
jgi:uncharacterized protein YjbI with pentapeptide repeats